MAEVQLGVGEADYNLMLNILKGSGRWNNISAPGPFDVSTLDANGYPTSLPTGGVQRTVRVPLAADLSQYYFIYWDGTGTVGTDVTLNAGSYSTSGCRIDIGSATSFQFKITAVGTPGSDYPHDIRILADNDRDVALYNSGQQFRPEALTLLSNASVLRFLDTQAGEKNGGYTTVVNWSDRKPAAYVGYLQHYFPPGKIVPTANITYDGSSKYTVTWSGQTGALTDKTQFIALVPSAAAGASTTNLNGTGDVPNLIIDSIGFRPRTSLGASRWALWTYDALTQGWIIDDVGTTSNTGISFGCPIEVLVDLANEVNRNPWFVSGMFWGDVDGAASDFPAGLAAYCQANLNSGLVPLFEVGPNETGNPGNFVTQYAYYAGAVMNGGAFGSVGAASYTVTGCTPGATTILTIGTNSTQVGSLVTVASVGGITGFGGGTSCRVLSKPNSTQIEVNVSTTGTYTSGGTATPVAFDYNNWYGFVANNIAAAIGSVYGLGNKGVTYRTYAGLLTFIGGASSTTSTSGQNTKLTSPFTTVNGGNPTYTYLSDYGSATYMQVGGAANTQASIEEAELAYEYTNATATRKTEILNTYAETTYVALNPVTITNITPGNPTVITVDDVSLFRTVDGETISFAGITGNIGTTLNRGAFNTGSMAYANTRTLASKTATTITVNVDTTGQVYSGGGTVSPASTASVVANNVYQNVLPPFAIYGETWGLDWRAYEGGLASDPHLSDPTATIKGITNGATTVINVGANAWDHLYNTLGLSGLTTRISGIAAGTLATLLNGNTYTILSATATTITINVDSSAASSWASGGTASYVGLSTAVNVLRNNVNFCLSAHMVTERSYRDFNALGGVFKAPSEFVLVGSTYGVLDGDIYSASDPGRYSAMKNRYSNLRRKRLIATP